MMNKLIVIVITAFMVMCFSTSAQADRKTVEGVMIGLGVAIVGGTIMHHYSGHHKHKYHRTHHTPPRNHYRQHRPAGHWEVIRTWQRGHYDRYGYWVPGHYISERVWVRR